jgi:hypothetical protein
MGLYVLLFGWALKRVTKIETEGDYVEFDEQDRFSAAFKERTSRSQQHRSTSHYSDGPRRTISQSVFDAGRTISYSIINDPTSEMIDDGTYLRSVSVA